VLLTSPDTLLATLTPALVAEANMLRERFAHRYHSSSLFGMNSRNRRGESSRRDIMAAGLDRNTGDPSRSTSKPIETEGAPLVDEDALKALIRLLRVVQVIVLFLLCALFFYGMLGILNVIASPIIIYSLYTRVSCRGFL